MYKLRPTTDLTQALNANWFFKKTVDSDWLPAEVPGCVHLDLLANQKIDDPFYRDNEEKIQWIGKADWEYRLRFDVSPEILQMENVELVLDGLDTYATVTLNGKVLFETDNMFHPWRTEVKSLLQSSENELHVLFHSPLEREKQLTVGVKQLLPAANDQAAGTNSYTRKAPYHYGWDWGPCLVTSGIWRGVRLDAWDSFKITDCQIIHEKLEPESAVVTATLFVEGRKSQEVDIIFSEKKSNHKNITGGKLKPGLNEIEVKLEIPSPQLWWPTGYGEQVLYPVQIVVNSDSESQHWAGQIGLRTLELRREPDAAGESFYFAVNGVPVFAKGANWIPGDSFTTRMTEANYRYLITSAVEANMNMLRVWGGGIYEEDIFYEICDELGVLVWQDFMFACGMYPGDDKFLANFEQEARYQMHRLRNHASLALWCGNNEIEQGIYHWGWKTKFSPSYFEDYLKLFHDLLPRVCKEEDATRTYWPSSPSSGLECKTDPQLLTHGDVHYWGVWHAKEPFESYLTQNTRFMSEYGFQSFPEMKTVRTYAIDGDFDIQSPVMTAHQRHGRGNELVKHYMEHYYRVPEKFEAFLLVSQIQQAQGLKLGAEYLRRLMPHCMGSLYWQINDCWPVASWASIDYHGRWKALHFYARRFYAPVLLSSVEEGGNVHFYIVSDLQEPLQAELTVRLLDFDGNVHFVKNAKVTVASLSSQVYLEIPNTDLPDTLDRTSAFFYCDLSTAKGLVSEASCYLARPKDQKLPKPELTVKVELAEGGFDIFLSSPVLVRDVVLNEDSVKGRFMENFFDIFPGVQKRVSFRSEGTCSLKTFRNSLTYLTLYDLMAS